MRRREELKRWLRSGTQNAGILSGFQNRFARELGARQKAAGIKAEPLAISATVFCLENAISPAAVVRDGLASLENPNNPMMPAVEEYAKAGTTVREEGLLGESRVCSLELHGESHVRLQEGRLFLGSLIRSLALSLKLGGVRSVDVLWERSNRSRDGGRFLMQNAVVPLPRYKIALLPHSRESVRIETLKDAERRSFLREAEALKGIAADRAELLVVFRHVPIEVISQMRFVAEKRVLLYSIVRQPGPRSTRVHDMAVVRDLESRELYLIPHRTQFRSVSLN
jgi:hypothetical protein